MLKEKYGLNAAATVAIEANYNTLLADTKLSEAEIESILDDLCYEILRTDVK